ncbi:MAG: hypothetical protein IH840_04790 [Candidatus Heimdallarchaeota archaeon]|nr:hypothetical protein [Candidatus Heimdallarchaeota archaeon]
MSDSATDDLPRWMMWYGVLVMIGAPLAFGLMTFFTADLGEVTLLNGTTIDTGNVKYGLRNLVAAIIAGLALYKRSKRMMLLVFIMRFLTEFGDFLDTVVYGSLSSMELIFFFVFMVVVFLAPYIYGIKTLWNATS